MLLILLDRLISDTKSVTDSSANHITLKRFQMENKQFDLCSVCIKFKHAKLGTEEVGLCNNYRIFILDNREKNIEKKQIFQKKNISSKTEVKLFLIIWSVFQFGYLPPTLSDLPPNLKSKKNKSSRRQNNYLCFSEQNIKQIFFEQVFQEVCVLQV